MKNKSFLQLKKNLKKDFSEFKKIKLALLGDSSTQFLNIAIKGLAYDYNLNLDIWESDYDQIPLQVFDSSSDLYSFNPDLILIFKSSHKLLQKYNYNLNIIFSYMDLIKQNKNYNLIDPTEQRYKKIICLINKKSIHEGP